MDKIIGSVSKQSDGSRSLLFFELHRKNTSNEIRTRRQDCVCFKVHLSLFLLSHYLSCKKEHRRRTLYKIIGLCTHE
jgi:hypothetical protein